MFQFNLDETISTLRFGQRAKAIKNVVKINQQRSLEELEYIIKTLTTKMQSQSRYINVLERELIHAMGKEWDFQAFKQAYVNESMKHTKQQSLADSLPATPIKNSTSGQLSLNLNSPMTGDSMSVQQLLSPKTSNYGIDLRDDDSTTSEANYLEPLALMEAQLAYKELKDEMELNIQDYQEEISNVSTNTKRPKLTQSSKRYSKKI